MHAISAFYLFLAKIASLSCKSIIHETGNKSLIFARNIGVSESIILYPKSQTMTSDQQPASAFFPTATFEQLQFRAAVVRCVRNFFESRGFLEVETPILSRDTVVDRYLEPFAVPVDDSTRCFYLQTSPEFAMKRLLSAGADAIFQIGRVFRRGDCGQMHNPEFTMLEWYRAGDDYESGIAFLSELTEAVLHRGKARIVTLRQLFAEQTGINPHTIDGTQLRDYARNTGIAFPESFGTNEHDREAWVDLIFSERIQPTLGQNEPVIVVDYLASQSQLAKTRTVFGVTEIGQNATRNDDMSFDVSERFELFVDGLELANGYHELLDADVLLERNRATNALRIADGRPALPEESRLIDAMRYGLPACSGCAMGLDRLIMAAMKTQSIADVIAFPWDRA